MHRLHKIQRLPISIDKAWAFFSSPKNLQKITPEFMGFDILSGADKDMYAGQIIKYSVKPVLGIPMLWVTEITQVVEKKYFVDTQLVGPYSIWHHTHFFREIEGGTEMEDIVDYKLPFGFLGKIVHALFVRRKVEQIFEYRTKIMDEMFGMK